MKTQIQKIAFLAIAATLLPLLSHAEGVADSIHSLQGVLDNLYDQMIPLCSRMIDLGRGIAGFAALFFIGSRVWKHIAAAEPIDFYPLLRPFAIGICIMSFPAVLAVINGVLKPTVTATAAMVGDNNQAINNMLSDDQQDASTGAASQGAEPEKWYQYSHPDVPAGAPVPTMADQFSGFGFRNWVKKAIAEILNVCFEAAALCIDTIRTFKLIVLAILGPLCFGLSIFDGFQHTLKQWLARYINVYMWLPVANIFGAIIAKIQANMLSLEQAGGAATPHFKDANTIYLIFMLIAIVGYFTVPSIANYIVNVGGHALFSKASGLTSAAVAITSGQIIRTMIEMEKRADNEPPKPSFPGGAPPTSGNSSSGPGGHLADRIAGGG